MELYNSAYSSSYFTWNMLVMFEVAQSHWHLEKYSGEAHHILPVILVFLKVFPNNIVRDRILH